MAKRFALQKKMDIRTGNGADYPTFVQFAGEVIPTVFENHHGTLETALLFTEEQLKADRSGRSTRELVEEHLPDYELVEVQLSQVSPNLSIEYGALMGEKIEVQLNKQGYTLGRKIELIEALNFAITQLKFNIAIDLEEESMVKKLHEKVLGLIQPLPAQE